VTYQNGQNQGVVQGKQTLTQHQVQHDQQARTCKKKREFFPGEKPQKIGIKTFEKFHDLILSAEIELLFLSAYESQGVGCQLSRRREYEPQNTEVKNIVSFISKTSAVRNSLFDIRHSKHKRSLIHLQAALNALHNITSGKAIEIWTGPTDLVFYSK
jgi:hypothetical protein